MRGRNAVAALVAASVGILGACNVDKEVPDLGPNTPQYGEQTIRIGFVTVLAGDLGDVLRVQAAELAVEQVNAAGGLLGRRVELLTRDYQGRNELAADMARELIEVDGVVGLLGASGSGASLAVAEVTSEYGVPQISCCSTSTALTSSEFGDYFFRVAPSDALQARVIVDVVTSSRVPAAGKEGTPKVGAVIYIDNAYGQTFKQDLTAGFKGRSDVQILDFFPYPEEPQDSDLVAVVNAIQAKESSTGTQVDFIVLVGYDDSGARLVTTWHQTTGRAPYWIASDGLQTPQFVSAVSGSRFANDVFSKLIGTGPAANPEQDVFQDLERLYTAAFDGDRPTGFTAHNYDAAILLMLAIQAAGTTEDRELIRDMLYRVSRNDSDSGQRDQRFTPDQLAQALQALGDGRDIDWAGTTGELDFDDNGDVVGGYGLWGVEDGAIVVREFVNPATLVQ